RSHVRLAALCESVPRAPPHTNLSVLFFSFFFNDTATTEIYTLSYTTLFRSARMAKLADAADLKSVALRWVWGFKSPSGHQIIKALSRIPRRAPRSDEKRGGTQVA